MAKDLGKPETENDFMHLKAQLEYEEALERKQARDSERNTRNAARLQNLETIRKNATNKAAEQANCPHMKPMNAGSAIAGQHDHKGVYHWICQYCHKEWQGGELPVHLRIDMNLVGGPSH